MGKGYRLAKTGLTAVSLLTSLMAWGHSSTPALAYSYQGCNPTRSGSSGNFGDGWYTIPTDGHTLTGSTVTANTYIPYTISGTSNSSLWSALNQKYNGDLGNGGAQVGYQMISGSPQLFVEWIDSTNTNHGPYQVQGNYFSGGTWSYLYGPTEGTSYSYNTFYDSTNDGYYFSVEDISSGHTYTIVPYGSTHNFDTSWTTAYGLGFSPQIAENSGETKDPGSQMFGDINHHETLASAGYYDGGWQYMVASGITNATGFSDSHFGHNPTGNNSLDIWDMACLDPYISASDTSHNMALSPGVGSTWSSFGTNGAMYEQAISGNYVGYVQYDGSPKNSYDFYIKDKGSGTTYEEYDGVNAIAIGGSVIGVLNSSNNFYAKSGLTSSWTAESTGDTAMAVASTGIAMIYSGQLATKPASGLGGSWTVQVNSGVSALAMSKTYLAYLSSGSEYAQAGLSGGFVQEAGCSQIDVSANYIGCLSGGYWSVKTGSLWGSWDAESGGCGGSVSQGITGDLVVGVICNTTGYDWFAGGLNSTNFVNSFGNLVYIAADKD